MARRDLRRDDGGQMMVLAAVLLVIGLVALAGMVSRVNQLGSQTGIESDKAILEEVVPLQDSIDTTLSTLQRRTFTGTLATAAGVTTVTSTSGAIFADSDVGLNITGGSISAPTHIASVTSSTVATLTRTATGSGTFAIFKPGFGLTSSTYVRVEDALVNALEHLQRIQASHGFWMDYELTCDGGDTAKGVVVAHLSDGTVWVEVRSNVYFPRTTSASCISVYG